MKKTAVPKTPLASDVALARRGTGPLVVEQVGDTLPWVCDPGFPLNCPKCGTRLVYIRTDGDTHFYRCPRHGSLILPPDATLSPMANRGQQLQYLARPTGRVWSDLSPNGDFNRTRC